MEKFSVNIGLTRELIANLLVSKNESMSNVAVVEHILEPGALAAPPHMHTREDGISIILEGELTLWEEGKISVFKAGEIAVKKRNILHTFWNAKTVPLRFLEIIAPGDFAGYFYEVDKILPVENLGQPLGEDVMQQLHRLNEKYAVVMDYEGVIPLMEKHGLSPFTFEL
jgi:mannose-6-phosphate isomerase-like protein (cupin superfamily)